MTAADPQAAWWRTNSFPLFLVSRLVAQAGTMAAVAALTVHVYATTESALAVGGLFVVRVAPRILGLFAGVIGDRLELRRLMVGCDLASSVVFLAIAILAPGYVALLVLVFLAECVATVSLPASRAMVGRTVPDDRLASANGMLFAATAIGFAVGSAVGALVAGAGDHRWALAGTAVSFIVSALLMTRLPAVAPEPPSDTDTFLAQCLAGLRVLRTTPDVVPVLIGLVGVAFGAAMDRPALIVLVKDDLRADSVWYGVALGGIAAGSMVVSLLAMRHQALGARALALFSAGILVQAAAHLAMGLSPVVALLVLGALVAGIGNGLESILGTTLLQSKAPKESLGALMGLVLSGSFLADALGSVIGGAMVDLTGARPTFLLAAAVILGCGLAVLRARRRLMAAR